MNLNKRILILLGVVSLLGMILGVQLTVQAETAALDYALNWWTVDGGGEQLSGDGYTLSGTIGQPDAGDLSGDGFTLSSGFWSRFAEWLSDLLEIYLPLIMR